ncbi:MAG TPA: glycoside hydrolase family 25 protein [Polyangia bacterium]|jgi:lysozyme|nr:glycoside hydrolase family 25 protein [Polyangia bacterium]
MKRHLILFSLTTLAACGGGAAVVDENGERGAETVVCPGSTVVRGIDVSYYQGSIGWGSVYGAGKRFAFVRVSDGTGFLDPNFKSYWNNAQNAGLKVGAYQFFRPSQDPIAQADLMVNQLNSVGFSTNHLPPVIDVEVTGGVSDATVASRVNSWLQRVQSRTGRLPALYTSPGFWGTIGNPTPNPIPYLWVAHWGVSCPDLPHVSYSWRLRWWQYSSTGSVSGISGNVDLDLYNGSLTEMIGL